ncbi:MAG: hypothetical protein RQ748_11485, partial [Elusimicrobiales bacterium]|nr:hypothetical protein [Elusimicrobiales bacterium]
AVSAGNVYQNSDFDVKNTIARMPDTGDIYVVNSFGELNSDIYVRKYDASGNIQWTDVFNSETGQSAYDYGRAIVVDASGVYVTGSIDANEISQGRNIWVRKYSHDGDILWTEIYNSGPYSWEEAHDLAIDGTHVYVTGSVNENVWVGKFNKSDGVKVDETQFDGQNGYSTGYSIAAGPGGGLWVAGSIIDSTGNNAVWLGKFDSAALAHIWASTYTVTSQGGYVDNALRSVKVDGGGNAYAAGYEYTETAGYNAWLAKYDPSGNRLFHRSVNGPSNADDRAYGLALDNLGNAWVTGKMTDYNSGQAENVWLAKYSPSGTQVLSMSIDRQYNSEVGYDVEVDTATGEAYVGMGMLYKYGIMKVTGLQSGSAALTAGPGPYTASVHLSWIAASGVTTGYKIQYSTYSEGMVWDSAAAQIDESHTAGPDAMVEHTVQGLRTYTDYEPGMMTGTNLPVYYFKAWVDGTPVNTAAVAAAPAAPYTNWSDFYAGGAQDRFWVINSAFGPLSAITRDAMGNTYLAYGGNIGGKNGVALQKMDQYGNTVRVSFHNSAAGDSSYVVTRLFADDSGLYAAGGVMPVGGTTGYAPWFARFGENGLVWERTIGSVGAEDELAYAITVDGSGNVYTAGSADDGAVKMFVAKHSPAGVLISSANYIGAGAASAEAFALARADSGDVFVGGYSLYMPQESDQQAAIVKFDSSLNLVTSAEYANSEPLTDNEDSIRDIVISTVTGAIYTTGDWYDLTGADNNRNLYVARISSVTLAEVWASTYNSVDNLEASGSRILVGADGDLYVAGWESRAGAPQHMNMLLHRFA